jgi:hypothetical protein
MSIERLRSDCVDRNVIEEEEKEEEEEEGGGGYLFYSYD